MACVDAIVVGCEVSDLSIAVRLREAGLGARLPPPSCPRRWDTRTRPN